LKNRYIKLYNECINRGYNVQNYVSAWNNVPPHLMNNYVPTKNDVKLIKNRINQKLKNNGKTTI